MTAKTCAQRMVHVNICKCGRGFEGWWGCAVRQCDHCFMRFIRAWGIR